jgi:acyl carrier protein
MGLDSVEIVLEAERLFNINLPDEKVTQIYTFGAFVDCIHETSLSLGRNTDRDEIVATLRKMVAKYLAVDESQITPDSRFIEDLGLS